jgi:hypothetical protein
MITSAHLVSDDSIVRNSHLAVVGQTVPLVSMFPHLAEDIYRHQFWHAVHDRYYGPTSAMRPGFATLLEGAVRTERPLVLLGILSEVDPSQQRLPVLESLGEVVIRLLNRVDSVPADLADMLRFKFSDKMVHVCLDLLESSR